jgi:NAD(P) transhydrogenase subunit beta
MQSIAAFLYLVSGVLFIMALRGLSHPATSRKGNLYGMVGMGIAIVTTLTLATPSFGGLVLIVLGLAIGGGAGCLYRPRHPDDLDAAAGCRLPLAGRPCRGAGRSLGALYAVLLRHRRDRRDPHRGAVEMALGAAIGALTFTGSIIAFLKLDGRMSGKPIMLPFRHVINAALLALIVFFIVGLGASESHFDFWAIVVLSLALGVLLIVPIGGADMPVVVSMLNSYSGWAAAGIGFTLGNLALIITGALVGSSGRSSPTSCARA